MYRRPFLTVLILVSGLVGVVGLLGLVSYQAQAVAALPSGMQVGTINFVTGGELW
jgi:hypothetical protein